MGSSIARCESIRLFSMEASQKKYLQTTVKDLDDLKTRVIDEIKIIKKGTLPDFFRQL